MNKQIWLLILVLALCLLATACSGWNPFGIPSEFKIDVDVKTESELGPETLDRIDKVNETLAQGIEIGPETRQLIEEINQTLRDGAKFGLDDATLARIDRLLTIIENKVGIQFGLDDKTLETVNDLINSIDTMPGRWEASAEEIVKVLEGSSARVAADMAKQVKSLMEEARLNTQKVIDTTGIQFRCNVDFLGNRAKSSIDEFIGHSIVGRLKAIITREKIKPALPTPWVCGIIPDQVQLTRKAGKSVFEKGIINITGYNYVDENLPQVRVEDENWQPLEAIRLPKARRLSPYQIQITLEEIDFSQVPPRSWVVLQWPNVPDTNSIAILQPGEQPRPQLVINVPPPPSRDTVPSIIRPTEVLIPGLRVTPLPLFSTPAPTPAPTVTGTVTVYVGPGTNYRPIGIAPHGRIYTVTGRVNDSTWWQIDYDGKTGWVAGSSVKRLDNLPVEVATYPEPPPTADFTFMPLTGTAPLTVTFADLSSGIGVTQWSWLWDFGDSGTSNKQNPTHVYKAAGTYTVKLTVSNSQESSTKEKQVVVNPAKPVADFQANPSSGTVPLTVTFTYKQSGGTPTNFTWDFGDGQTSDKESPPPHAYNTAGTYTVKLTVSNSQGSSTKQASVVVSLPQVKADFKSDPKGGGELPLTVKFTDKSSGGPTSWTWDFGDGQSYSGQSPPPHTYKIRGNFTVKLTVRNAANSSTATQTIVVQLPSCGNPKRVAAVSEETPPGFCPDGFVLKGIKCIGSYCDDMELLCCPYMEGQDSSATWQQWSSFVSEEQKYGYSTNTGFVFGIKCRGSHCDDVSMWVKATPNLTNAGQCYFKSFFSEDTPEDMCPPGEYVAGMKFTGHHSDNVSLYCCKGK